LHVVTDVELQTRYSHAEIAELAASGGADSVQFRDKRPRTTRELIEDARAVTAACVRHAVMCIVDDRADVAAAAGAQGLHLGRNDLPVEVARRLLGREALIGATANTIEEARRACQAPIDYLGVGPVWATASKGERAPALGLDGLHAIVRECPVPVIAIGCITASRVGAALDTGAYGVAVLSAITCAPSPRSAATEFKAVISEHLGLAAGAAL